MRTKLTVKQVEKLKAPHPSGKQQLIWDAELKGFGVLVSGKTPSRTYICQRDLPGGKTRRVTIGAVNTISVTDARDKAAKVLQEMREGIDPKRKSSADATLK